MKNTELKKNKKTYKKNFEHSSMDTESCFQSPLLICTKYIYIFLFFFFFSFPAFLFLTSLSHCLVNWATISAIRMFQQICLLSQVVDVRCFDRSPFQFVSLDCITMRENCWLHEPWQQAYCCSNAAILLQLIYALLCTILDLFFCFVFLLTGSFNTYGPCLAGSGEVLLLFNFYFFSCYLCFTRVHTTVRVECNRCKTFHKCFFPKKKCLTLC